MMKPSPKHQLRSPTPTGEHSTHIPGPPLPTPPPQQGQPQGSAGLLLTGVSTRSPGEGGPGGPAQWVTIPTLPPTYHTPDWLLFLVFYSLHMLKAPPGEGTVTMTRAWGGGAVRGWGALHARGALFSRGGLQPATRPVLPTVSHLLGRDRGFPCSGDTSTPVSPAASIIATDREMEAGPGKRAFPCHPLTQGPPPLQGT